MPTTTEKRGPGRPATKTATKKVEPKPAFQIKRQVPKDVIKEYRTLKPMGATFMMQQKGTTVFDAEQNTVRELRYCPNEPSVWRDEQSDSATRKSVVFQDGKLWVRPDQPNLNRFMELHPGNKENGGTLFELVNKEKKAEVHADTEFLMADAITMVRDKDLEDLMSVAVASGINIDRPVAEIKHDLLVYAKRNPKSFIDSFDNPVVQMKTKLKMAEKYQVIKLTASSVNWFDSGKMIVSVPAGKDPMDVFVRYCLTESAVSTLEEIDRQLQS